MDIVSQSEEGTTYRMTPDEIEALKTNPVIHCPLCPVPIPARCPHITDDLGGSDNATGI